MLCICNCIALIGLFGWCCLLSRNKKEKYQLNKTSLEQSNSALRVCLNNVKRYRSTTFGNLFWESFVRGLCDFGFWFRDFKFWGLCKIIREILRFRALDSFFSTEAEGVRPYNTKLYLFCRNSPIPEVLKSKNPTVTVGQFLAGIA